MILSCEMVIARLVGVLCKNNPEATKEFVESFAEEIAAHKDAGHSPATYHAQETILGYFQMAEDRKSGLTLVPRNEE